MTRCKLLEFIATHNIARVDHVQPVVVDCDDDLGILVYNQTGQTFRWSLYLTSEERTAVVGKRPTKLQIFSHQALWRSITWNSLENKIIKLMLMKKVSCHTLNCSISRASAEDLLLADQGSQERIPPVFLTACSGMNRSRFCLKNVGVWMAMS